jgi:hypothetical protein
VGALILSWGEVAAVAGFPFLFGIAIGMFAADILEGRK